MESTWSPQFDLISLKYWGWDCDNYTIWLIKAVVVGINWTLEMLRVLYEFRVTSILVVLIIVHVNPSYYFWNVLGSTDDWWHDTHSFELNRLEIYPYPACLIKYGMVNALKSSARSKHHQESIRTNSLDSATYIITICSFVLALCFRFAPTIRLYGCVMVARNP